MTFVDAINQQASLLTGFAFETPVRAMILRSDDWFAQRRAAIFAAAVRIYGERRMKEIGIPHLASLPQEALDVMFARVKDSYQEMALTGSTTTVLRHGCCALPNCSFANWQVSVLTAIREIVREEESTRSQRT